VYSLNLIKFAVFDDKLNSVLQWWSSLILDRQIKYKCIRKLYKEHSDPVTIPSHVVSEKRFEILDNNK